MASRQRVEDLRAAVLDALGIKLSADELGVLAGRLRFDDTPPLSQQAVADRLRKSQPYVSNVERELMRKLHRRAERQREMSRGNSQIHDLVDGAEQTLADIKKALGPRPIRLKRLSRP